MVKRRKNLRTKASGQKPSTFVEIQDKDCLSKIKDALNEADSSIEEEIPKPEDKTYFEPFRVKTRSLIANISSYVAMMEINIFHNWSCIAPEPQDMFGMLEGAEKLSCFLEDKFYGMEDNEDMQSEVENIKYTYCRSKIIIYIIKNIVGTLRNIDNDLIYEKIIISEVAKHLHLIKRFGLKLPMDCSILKVDKNKLSFSDFAVMIESNLGTFSLKQTEQVKGILKKTAGEVCKTNFPISFLEGESLKSYETHLFRQTNNFEDLSKDECEVINVPEKKPKRQLRARTSSFPKKLNIENNSEQLSLTNEIVKFPANLENCLVKKKRGYNKKQKGRKLSNIINETGEILIPSNDLIKEIDREKIGFFSIGASSEVLINLNDDTKEKIEYEERTKSTETGDVLLPSGGLINAINKERTKPTNETDEVLIPSDALVKDIDIEKNEPFMCTSNDVLVPSSDDVTKEEMEYESAVTISSYDVYEEETRDLGSTKPTNETDKVLIPSDVLIKDIDKEKNEPMSVCTFSEVLVPLSDNVTKEEIEYGGEVTVSSCDVYPEDTRNSEKTSEVVVNIKHLEPVPQPSCLSGSINSEENTSEIVLNIKHEELAPKPSCLSGSINSEEKTSEIVLNIKHVEPAPQPSCLNGSINSEAAVCISSSKTWKNRKNSGKSLLRSKNTSYQGTSLLTPANSDNNVERKKRPYIRKQKGSSLSAHSSKFKQEAQDSTTVNISLVPVVQNNEEDVRRIDPDLCNKIDTNKSMNLKKYKKSEITIPATKIIKNYFKMDMKTLNNKEKLTNIIEFKDKGSIHHNNVLLNVENEINENSQPLVIDCNPNAVGLVKGVNPEFAKKSGIDCGFILPTSSKNLEETVKTKKTCHYRSEGFTSDTLERIIKVIDDPSYEGNDLKKTLSGIINETKGSHMPYFYSSENAVTEEHNYVKTHSVGNEFNSNPDSNCKADFHNEIFNETNYSLIKNTPTKTCLINKNINDSNNNVTDNKLPNDSSITRADSLGINSDKMNYTVVETTIEELMNTEQFIQNSIDVNYSQNIMPSPQVCENDLNSVSLSKITKLHHFKGNNDVKSLDLDFSDLYWA
nr:uncharacterized protein LOC106692575 isoform X3 [Halyomorpha halys]